MIKAVIFDLDGTLLDTEKYYLKTWPEALQHFGYPGTREFALEIRSLGRPFSLAYFKEKFGESVDYWAVRDYRKALVNELVKTHGIQAKAGASEILLWLREKGIQTAIATASPVDRAKKFLELAGLSADLFGHIISAADAPEGKPAPDVYLFACRELGLDPSECLAVEDAPNGVLSAHRAGMPVVMVPDATEPDEALQKIILGRADTLLEVKNFI